jgi:hypothetical protein
VIVAEVNEGECCLGFWVEFEVFKVNVVDKGQVHRRERGDGYCFLGANRGVYITFGAHGSHSCGVCRVEFSDQVWAISISCSFPAVMSGGISLPPKEILQLLVASYMVGAEDLFYFVFRLIINQFRQRFGVISAMFRCFSIQG